MVTQRLQVKLKTSALGRLLPEMAAQFRPEANLARSTVVAGDAELRLTYFGIATLFFVAKDGNTRIHRSVLIQFRTQQMTALFYPMLNKCTRRTTPPASIPMPIRANTPRKNVPSLPG